LKVSGGTAGASGASGYSATPLSSAQFAALGEHACVSLRRQLRGVTAKRPSSRKGAVRSVRTVASTLAGLNMELDGKAPPRSEVAPFRRLLGGIQTAERGMNQLDHLTETGQWQRATLLVRSPSWRAIGNALKPSARAGGKRCGPARRIDAVLTAVAVRVSGGTSAASYYFARPLSVAEFAHGIERICVSARARLEELVAAKPASLPDAASKIDTLTSSFDGYLAELRGLTPPPSIAAPFRHVLANLQLEDRAMHDLDELGKTGQWQRAEQLLHSRRWQSMLDRFGPPVRPADIRCG
jgi:hypothetical protein